MTFYITRNSNPASFLSTTVQTAANIFTKLLVSVFVTQKFCLFNVYVVVSKFLRLGLPKQHHFFTVSICDLICEFFFTAFWKRWKFFSPHFIGSIEAFSLTTSAVKENFLPLPTEWVENFFQRCSRIEVRKSFPRYQQNAVMKTNRLGQRWS